MPPGLDRKDKQNSIESFRSDVVHALGSGIQLKLVSLFKSGDNSEGFMLLIGDNAVRWEKRPDDIKKFINAEATASSFR